MSSAIGDPVCRAIVTRSGQNGYASGGGKLEDAIHCRGSLLSPGGLRTAPGDGKDGGAVCGVGNCFLDCMNKALIGVGSEINQDFRPGSDCSCNLNVQFDLAIRSVGVTRGRILGAINSNGGNLGSGNTQAFEIRIQVLFSKASAQLDQADLLAASVEFRRKVVELRKLGNRESSTHWSGTRDGYRQFGLTGGGRNRDDARNERPRLRLLAGDAGHQLLRLEERRLRLLLARVHAVPRRLSFRRHAAHVCLLVLDGPDLLL